MTAQSAKYKAKVKEARKEAELLRRLSAGLHPVLLVEPLTTVGKVTKWYTGQVGKNELNAVGAWSSSGQQCLCG